MIRILKHRVFRRLFAAQVVALLGTGLLTVALGLLAYDLAGAKASIVLGTAYTIKMVAYVGLSPVAGALFAKYPRKPVLIGADLVRAAVALSLPFISEVWQIYVAIFLLQSASATFTPAFQATIPDILTDEGDYTRALSLSRLAYDIENVISPLIAGLLLVAVSFHWLFGGTAIGFLASAVLVMSVRLPDPKPTKDRPFGDRLTRGVRIYLGTPRLRGLLSLNFAAASLGAFVIVNTVLLVREILSLGETHVAAALGAFGAGSMIAALALPGLLDRLGDRRIMMFAAFSLVGLTISAGGLWLQTPINWTSLLLLWSLIGLLYSAILTPSGRLLRRSAHAEDRGAVFTAHFALSHGCWLITYPLAGWGIITLGAPLALLVLASLGVVGLISALLVWPSETSAPVTHSHPELPPDHPHLKQTGPRHSHRIIIDDEHQHWPTHG